MTATPAPDWRVAANRVNVRAGPGMDHAVQATLARDTPLRLEARAGAWGRFSWQDGEARRQGWLFLDLAAPAASDL
jgi:SH3-like domain-containing protein